MDHEGPSDQRQKELSITLAASSMINASDMISEEAYQANLRRIQEVKEMVQKLEMNNESAHQNFIVSQLERRARDGREADGTLRVMLTQLRSRPGPSGTVQFTNSPQSGKSEVILPTSATLVEVPDSHSSSSSSLGLAAISPPQLTQQGRSAEYQRNLAGHVHQPQSYNPNVFRYYTPPSAVCQPRFGAAPRSQAPIDGHTDWYAAQRQAGVHNQPAHQPSLQQAQAQQPSQSWNSSAPQVVALPAADIVPAAPGYHTSSLGWNKTAPVHSHPNNGYSGAMYREPVFPTQPTESRLSVTAHNQLQNLPLLASTSRVQVPPLGVPVPPAKVSSGQAPPTRFHSQPVDLQSRPMSTTVSNPVAISGSPMLHHQPQPQPQLPPQPQQLSQPPQQPRQRPPQPQAQRLPQPPLQPQQEPPQPLEPLSQRPLQPPYLPAPPQSASHAPCTGVSRSESQPSQVCDSPPVNTPTMISQTELPQATIAQEQAPRRGVQLSMDQATFVKLFQIALQRGSMSLKIFLLQAKASGINDEWFRAAINSLPRNVWHSFVAQVNQSGHVFDVGSSANLRPDVSTISDPSVPVVTARPLPTATSPIQTTPVSQPVAKLHPLTEGRSALSAPEQTSEPYTAQLRYYAEHATRSVHSAGIATTIPVNVTSIKKTVSTPAHGAPQAQVSVRAPKDANKSTLARDILRSLGKVGPRLCQDTASKPADENNNHEDGQILGINAASCMACLNVAVAPPRTSSAPTDSPSTPLAEPNIHAKPPLIRPQNLSTTKSVLNEELGQGAAVEGPIMIDLTLDDSDGSVDGNGQEPEPTYPMQTSTSAATTSRPVSPANTTSRTPLLENLSSEEQSVDAAPDGDSADVRMYSPPLPHTAKENMESGLSHPPLVSAELVPSSLELSPREASEHSPDGQLPLFLPSPPVSPAPTEPPETDIEMTNDEGESGASHKRCSADVDETGSDMVLLIPSHVRKRSRQQMYVLIPPPPLYVKQAIKRMKEHAMGRGIDSDLEWEEDDDEIQYSHLEQLLIEESKSRLSERRCLWLNCGAVLNCTANLLAHLKRHAREEDSQAPFPCRWASCRRQFDMEHERDIHLERHTIRPLPCPFAGCEEQFSRPVEVMQHEVQHQKAEHREPLVRKSTYQPVVPAIPTRLGPPPQRLPSHRVIPRRVVKCRISADRHATMGPWVLWNIFGPVELCTRKQNASMRGRPWRQVTNCDMDSSDSRRDDYDFLRALSSYPARGPQLDDLDSTMVTMSAARGLTLWGSGSGANSAARSATPEECAAVGAAAPTSAEGEEKSDRREAAATEGILMRRGSSDDCLHG